MEKEKKYWFPVGIMAEGETFGWMKLTEAEAEVVAQVTNCMNWECLDEDDYSGGFWIGLKHKRVKKPTTSPRDIWYNCWNEE